MRPNRMFKVTLLSTLAISVALLGVITPHRVSALSGSEFQAGRIIDDGVFYNPGSMSEGQIQEFLNAKVPTCDTNGTQPYAGTTRASYGTSRGYPPPYTCLKDYSQMTTNKSPEDLLCNGHVAGQKTAARIIKEVADSCGVSPKVLIVLLQKEQSLVTDDWPWSIQYRSATGYGCPDTAPCDAQYYGFFNQVYNAARIYKYYAKYPNSFNHLAGRNNNILYNPNTGCGSSSVYIHNQATAGLYNYTPYQPNSAALNNLYGTGDSCSAYGNRNFWRMYSDWFGSTYSPNFNWSLVSQSIYTDSTKTISSSGSLQAGTKVYAVIKAKNTGNSTWNKNGVNTVRLGTVGPLERASQFCDPTWLSCSRPSAMVEDQVLPNEVATFEFWINAPLHQGGHHKEYFSLVVEGNQWMRDIGLYYSLNVTPLVFSWEMVNQYAFTDSDKATVKRLDSLIPGEKSYVGFTAKNTSNFTWTNNGPNALMAGTLEPHERFSRFATGSNWLSSTRPALLKEPSVPPGGLGTFEFWLTTPTNIDISHERFGLVANGLSWFNDTGLSYYTKVVAPRYSWELQSQYAYTDQNKTTPKNMANTAPGEKVFVGFTAKNTGNVTWLNSGPNAVLVGTESPKERSSNFSISSSWLSGTRPSLLKEVSVAPGQIGTFEFWLTANTLGIHNERFNIVANNLAWFNDVGLSYYINVISN